jgi:hypothetical protein
MTIEEAKTKEEQARRDLAHCYARVLLGNDDGKRVLRDLRAKFGTDRAVFRRQHGQRYDALEAAVYEGERRVMADIEAALKTAAPGQWAESLI